ncbi:hypothetical protein YPPY93_3326, partial [Yersinia pestis PY-93]
MTVWQKWKGASIGSLRLLTKCPRRREQADRKDAV